MNEELTNLLEGIETANNIKQYEEGLADVVKGAGRAIANVFGTKAGAAQRDLKAAQNQAAAAQANANLVNAQQAAQQILKTLQNDITKTKVGNFVKGVGQGIANGAKNLAKAGAAAGSKMMGGNEIDQQQASNVVDNVAQGAKDLKNKASNAAHGEAKTASEKDNAKNQQQKQQGGNK